MAAEKGLQRFRGTFERHRQQLHVERLEQSLACELNHSAGAIVAV
jgi:hypothetical protein